MNVKKRKPLKLDLEEGAFRKTLRRKYGSRAFKKNGNIKVSYARKELNSRNMTTRKRAQFFLNARKWKKRGRKKTKS